MKITFINPCIRKDKIEDDGGEFSFAISILSASLKKHGFDTSLIQITRDFSDDEITAILRKENADIYAFYLLSHFLSYIKKWVKIIKATTNAFVVCGGVPATLNPAEIISIEGVDSVCIGEGDDALVELCISKRNGKLNPDIQNLWFKLPDGSIKKNRIRPLLSNLDILPFFDTSIFNMDNLRSMRLRIPFVPIMISRGCPFSCYYCSNSYINELYRGLGKYVRFMSPERAVAEVQQMLKSLTKKATVNFADNTFDSSKKWILDFCKLYRDKIKVPFRAMGRAERIDDEICSALKDAGCFRFTLGVESGSERIRFNYLNRKLSNSTILNAMQLLKKHGIQVATYNMCGIPTETKEEMLETIKLNAKGNIDFAICSIFWPYEGTKLYHIAKNKGLLNENSCYDNYTNVFENSILMYEKNHKEHIQFNARWFTTFVYLYRVIINSNSPVSNELENILDNIYFSKDKEQIDAFLKLYNFNALENIMYSKLEKPILKLLNKTCGDDSKVHVNTVEKTGCIFLSTFQ